MIRKILTLLFFLSCSLYAAKLPEISPKDVIETLRHIMEAHVSCKELNGPLISRGLEHYLEELDPTKTYLLEGDVSKWVRSL